MSGLRFAPGRIGGVEIRSRVLMPSMTTRLADAEGFVTAAAPAWFGAPARDGAGLVTVEMASPETAGRLAATGAFYPARSGPAMRAVLAIAA